MKIANIFIAAATALTLIGCATHTAIKQPNLNSRLDTQQNKQIVSGVEVMARPLHSIADLKANFDEDLILYGVLPFHVSFRNTNSSICHINMEHMTLIQPDGSSCQPLNLDQVCDSASKSYFRTAGWGVAFGIVGAIPSLINVAMTNDKIKADYESCMIKNGDLVSGAYTEGALFFPIDKKIQSLDGYRLNLTFVTDDQTNSATFDLSGEVEQPRVKEHKADDK